MDWAFISQHLPLYVEAAKLTLSIGFLGIILSFVVGLITSLLQFYKVPILSPLTRVYVELSRNTPLLVQLFFLYFGLPRVGITLSSEACAIVGLTFLGGAYMSESIRSGLMSVTTTQFESALSLGLNKWQIARYILLPQALTFSLPGLAANTIFLLKETSVFSAVALADLMYVAKDLIGLYYQTDEALLMLVTAYLIILLPISLGFHFLERRVRFGIFGD